jgi:hypothetical protein
MSGPRSAELAMVVDGLASGQETAELEHALPA